MVFIKDGLDKIVVFELCNGNGAISNLLEPLCKQVIRRDLYTMPEKHDYLKDADPAYDLLVTNLPFVLKYKFLEKAIKSGKPFALLMLVAALSTKAWFKVCGQAKLHVQMLNFNAQFIHKNEKVTVTHYCWVYGNFPTLSENKFSYFMPASLPSVSNMKIRTMLKKNHFKP